VLPPHGFRLTEAGVVLESESEVFIIDPKIYIIQCSRNYLQVNYEIILH